MRALLFQTSIHPCILWRHHYCFIFQVVLDHVCLLHEVFDSFALEFRRIIFNIILELILQLEEMSVPEKVLMRKIKKREKTKLTVLKRLEEQKESERANLRDAIESEKITDINQQFTEDVPPEKKRKVKISEE
ncbi:uncharacterized protein LOC112552970, partial [Pogonomyrmex barbatus]|uniref:Uncharacterized protein LOC112552970 n=1 Tax=Pogonomyrmex barbatus TaxID=144034 RepID=A0A8N1SBK3_9HYME